MRTVMCTHPCKQPRGGGGMRGSMGRERARDIRAEVTSFFFFEIGFNLFLNETLSKDRTQACRSTR